MPADVQDSASASSAVPAKQQTPRYPIWRVYVLFAFLGGLSIAWIWQPSNRQYIASAWEQQTFFPEHPVDCGCMQCLRETPMDSFRFKNASIPVDEIHSGGPPKDGIPALTDPKFLTVEEAEYLSDSDRVIGVIFNEAARAYPLRVLNYHEIVNDTIGDQSVAITYCPLCDSVVAFDRETPLGIREFGVSGLLYNSNVLMYDRKGEPESLWSQLKTQGVTGPASKLSLTTLPVELTTWSDWKSRYPKTVVLSLETGIERDYSRSPYEDYFAFPELMFPVEKRDTTLSQKTPVLGVWTANGSKAYPLPAMGKAAREFSDTINGKKFTLAFNPSANSIRVVSADEGVEWMYSLWFAWYAFRPETEVYSSAK